MAEKHTINNPGSPPGSQNVVPTTNQQSRQSIDLDNPVVDHVHQSGALDSVNITVDITLRIPRHPNEVCPNCRDARHSANAYILSGQDNPSNRPGSTLYYTITPEMVAQRQLVAHSVYGRRTQNPEEGVDVADIQTERARIRSALGIIEETNTTLTDGAAINNTGSLTLYPPAAHPTTGGERLVPYFQRRSSMDSMLAQAGGDTPRSAFPESPTCTCQHFMTCRNTELEE